MSFLGAEATAAAGKKRPRGRSSEQREAHGATSHLEVGQLLATPLRQSVQQQGPNSHKRFLHTSFGNVHLGPQQGCKWAQVQSSGVLS